MKTEPKERKRETAVPRVLRAWRDKFIALVEKKVEPRHEWKRRGELLRMMAREERVVKEGKGWNRATVRRKNRKDLTRGAFAKYGNQFGVSYEKARTSHSHN